MNDRMVNELHAIFTELGGKGTFGRSLETEGDLQSAIREGFPQEVVEKVMDSASLTLTELAASLDLLAACSDAANGAAWRVTSRTASIGWHASLHWPSTTLATTRQPPIGSRSQTGRSAAEAPSN